MFTSNRRLFLGAAIAAGASGTTRRFTALAQESTATPDPFTGVTTAVLAAFQSQTAAGHQLLQLRITMEPGALIPAHGHPGDVALSVESGVFATTFVRSEGAITRAPVGDGAAVVESTTTDTEYLLNVGDSLSYGRDAAHSMANGGEEPLVLLVSALLAADEPGFLFVH